jgi:hypothetical protein
MAPTPALIAVSVAFVLLSGCTTSTPIPSPSAASPATTPAATAPESPSATPTPTWSTDQAAAIAAVDGYRASSDQIGREPSVLTEAQMKSLLGKWAGPEVVKANVASYLALKKRGFRYDTGSKVLSTAASSASDTGYGTEVVVTRCIDQSPARVLNKNGEVVSESELGYSVPRFLLRQYTAQQRAGDKTFRVYGLAPAKGDCGPS